MSNPVYRFVPIDLDCLPVKEAIELLQQKYKKLKQFHSPSFPVRLSVGHDGESAIEYWSPETQQEKNRKIQAAKAIKEHRRKQYEELKKEFEK